VVPDEGSGLCPAIRIEAVWSCGVVPDPAHGWRMAAVASATDYSTLVVVVQLFVPPPFLKVSVVPLAIAARCNCNIFVSHAFFVIVKFEF
jgi:hypothetical protein